MLFSGGGFLLYDDQDVIKKHKDDVIRENHPVRG